MRQEWMSGINRCAGMDERMNEEDRESPEIICMI